jgi:hypothetical protein
LRVGDPGVGASRLGEVNTSTAYGIAVPENDLVQNFGRNPAAWRTARAQVNTGGTQVQVPIIDIGPGSGPVSRGAVTDLSHPLAQGLGASGWDPARVQLIPNAGPDYTTDRDAWDQEQSNIAANFSPASDGQTADSASADPDPDQDLSDAIRGEQVANALSSL